MKSLLTNASPRRDEQIELGLAARYTTGVCELHHHVATVLQ